MLETFEGFLGIQDLLLLSAHDSTSISGETSRDVESLFSLQGLMTLGMLVLLQAVLGFDNLLYNFNRQ